MSSFLKWVFIFVVIALLTYQFFPELMIDTYKSIEELIQGQKDNIEKGIQFFKDIFKEAYDDFLGVIAWFKKLCC